jgi:hypothetical protein
MDIDITHWNEDLLSLLAITFVGPQILFLLLGDLLRVVGE